MTAQLAATTIPLGLAIVAIAASMVAGVADVLRLPGWAWRKAEEPKIAYVALVGLLPVAGLAMYVVRARAKVKDVALAGRAASLPFERFGDGAPPMDEEQVAEAPEPIQLVALQPDLSPAVTMAPMTSLSSVVAGPSPSPGPVTVAPAGTLEPVAEQPAAAAEPGGEPVTVGGDTFFSTRSGHGSGAVAPTATRSLRLPASLASLANRPYRPRQRESLAEERLTPAVPAGWKADPTGRHQFRYWNGSHWTENVADAGVQDRDAVCA